MCVSPEGAPESHPLQKHCTLNCVVAWPNAPRAASLVCSDLLAWIVKLVSSSRSDRVHEFGAMVLTVGQSPSLLVRYSFICLRSQPASCKRWGVDITDSNASQVDVMSLGPTELCCFYINLYNLMVIHSTLSKRSVPLVPPVRSAPM